MTKIRVRQQIYRAGR